MSSARKIFFLLFLLLPACGSPSIHLKDGEWEGPPSVTVGSYNFYSYIAFLDSSSGQCDGLGGIACDDYDPGIRGVEVHTAFALVESPPGSQPKIMERGEEGSVRRYLMFKPDQPGTYRIKVTSDAKLTTRDDEVVNDSRESYVTLQVVPQDTSSPRLVVDKEYASLSELENEVGSVKFRSDLQTASLLSAGTAEKVQFLWGFYNNASPDVVFEQAEIGGEKFAAPFYGTLTSQLTSLETFYADSNGDGLDEMYLKFDWLVPDPQHAFSFYLKLHPVNP